jgi:hypothetical protein
MQPIANSARGSKLMSSHVLHDRRRNNLIAVAFAVSFFHVGIFARGQQPSTPPLYGGNAATTANLGRGGGSSTAGVFKSVLDSEKRPITAGGFVKTGPIIYQDISEKSGLTVWHHKMGTPQKTFILETTGSGVALLDYDHDGWLDIYLVNGSTYEAIDGKAEPPHAALFHNNHDGQGRRHK